MAFLSITNDSDGEQPNLGNPELSKEESITINIFGENNMSESLQSQFMQLSESLKNSTKLKDFSIYFVSINNQDKFSVASYLSSLLFKNNYLHYLPDNFFEFLKNNNTIEKLNLDISSEIISSRGLKKLQESLNANKSLKELEITYDIRAKAQVEQILNTLKIDSLVALHLLSNNSSDKILSRVCANNKNLTMLSNGIGSRIRTDILKDNLNLLNTAAENFMLNKPLSVDQISTLTANAEYDKHEQAISQIYPKQLRKQFLDSVYYNGADREHLTLTLLEKHLPVDNIKQINEFLTREENKKLSEVYSYKHLANLLNQETEKVLELYYNAIDKKMINVLFYRNNIYSIRESLKKNNISMEEVTTKFKKISENKTCAYFLQSNKKVLVGLLKLKEEQLDKAITLLNHPAFKDFIHRRPEELVNLSKIEDPEKMLFIAESIRNDPEINKVKQSIKRPLDTSIQDFLPRKKRDTLKSSR